MNPAGPEQPQPIGSVSTFAPTSTPVVRPRPILPQERSKVYREGESNRRVLTNSEIEKRLSHRLDIIHEVLDDEHLKAALRKGSLVQAATMEGIAYDKLLKLRGEPTITIGASEQRRIDELVPAL